MELTEASVRRSDQAARLSSAPIDRIADHVAVALHNFDRWLEDYGETSWDHQSFFAGPTGRFAKSLYYKAGLFGTATVAPIIFCEAFLPDARRLFHHRIRLPIADAHYAMGFAFLFQATRDTKYFDRAIHFLDVLETARCPGFKEYCWGYPFDWVTRGGIIKRETPLITTTPYVYEAFLQMFEIEARPSWKETLGSIARHVAYDIKSFGTSERGSSSSYTPSDGGGVINAAAYRAYVLRSAASLFDESEYSELAERNLSFVLETQNADGSWLYAVDRATDFVDHFHTCFVLKALAKIYTLSGNKAIEEALAKGVTYYLQNLFYEDGMPKPFSLAPRLTVYKCELYDYAECINLCLLLRQRFPQLNDKLHRVVSNVLTQWVKKDGSFRSRRLLLGWDNVPMHRWGQSQMFRSLALYVNEQHRRAEEVSKDQISQISVPIGTDQAQFARPCL